MNASRAASLGIIAAVAAVAACGSGTPNPPATINVEITPAEGTWYGTPRTLAGGAILNPGLLVPINDDDSDAAGGADHSDAVVNGDDDMKQLTRFTIRKPSSVPAAADVIHLTKGPATGNVRVFRRGATPATSNVILDTGAATTTTPAEGAATRTLLTTGDAEFLVEGLAAGDIQICAVWSGASSATSCAQFRVFSGYAAGFGPRVFGNSNRNGTHTWADDAGGRRAWSETSGALVFVNRDEDCTPGAARDGDNSTLCAADLSDVTPIKWDAGRTVTIGDWKPTLWIADAEAGHVRVFGNIVDGATTLPSTTETVAAITYKRFDLTAFAVGGGEKTLGIEGLDYDKPVTLYHCVTHLPSNVSVACDLVVVRTGRVLLQSNNEELAQLIVGGFADNAAMRTGIAAAMPAGTMAVYPGSVFADQWVQDEIEIAGHASAHASVQVTLHLPRGNNLALFARFTSGANHCYENLVGQSVPAMTHPALGSRPAVTSRIIATRHPKNFGGNLEVTGPSATDDGRIILGTNMEGALRAEIEKLAAIQKPTIALDVDWLSVEHVDEVVVVYPTGASGWRVAVADVDLGIQLLTAATPRHALFWHCTASTTSRTSSCYGHDDVASASVKSGATPAKLTSKTFNFGAAPPAAKKWNYIRIYAGPGRGQVAHVSKVNGKTIEVDHVWNLPTPDWVRCAEVPNANKCDHAAAGLAAPTGAAAPFWPSGTFRKDDWFVVPTSASKFVVVEETLDFDTAGRGSAHKAAPTTPAGIKRVPALITAGELGDTTTPVNKAFLDKQSPLISAKLTAVAGAFAYAGGPTVVRVPALYFVVKTGTAIDFGDAYIPGVVNLQAVRVSTGPVLLAPKPYGPTDGGADPFETTTSTKLGITPAFVDDWNTYHIQSGEVHCGTNHLKASVRSWW